MNSVITWVITQEIVKKVRPSLSRVSSIIFRAEEEIMDCASASVDFYDNVIAPNKGSGVWDILMSGLL